MVRTDAKPRPERSSTTTSTRIKLFRSILIDLFYEYAANTKVNGLYYLRRGKTSGALRVLWTAIPISILLFGSYLVYQLASQFNAVPTLMIIDRPRPVHAVPFPAVTFCHPQTVLDYKARQFVAGLRQLPDGTNATAVLEALPALGMFVENPWGVLGDAPELALIDRTLRANGYTVAAAVRELGLSCRDFIKVCAWSKVEFDCFPADGGTGGDPHLSFRTTTSYLGVCCSFNYQPGNGSYDAYRASTFGTRGGLSIIGSGWPQVADGKSGVLFSSGFMMLLHHPYDYPVEGNQMNLVEIGAVTSVAVYPTLTHSSPEVQALPMRSRRCVLDGEVDGGRGGAQMTAVYRQPACAVGCTRRFIYHRCGCHPFHMPRPVGEKAANGSEGLGGNLERVRDCTAIDAACFARNFRRCSVCVGGCMMLMAVDPLQCHTVGYFKTNTINGF